MNYFKVEETTKKLHSLGHCQPIWVSVKFCKLICVSTGWNIAFLRGHTRAAVPGFGWVWPAQGYIKEFSEENSIAPEIRVGRSTVARVLLQSAYVCLIRNKEWACWVGRVASKNQSFELAENRNQIPHFAFKSTPKVAPMVVVVV